MCRQERVPFGSSTSFITRMNDLRLDYAVELELHSLSLNLYVYIEDLANLCIIVKNSIAHVRDAINNAPPQETQPSPPVIEILSSPPDAGAGGDEEMEEVESFDIGFTVAGPDDSTTTHQEQDSDFGDDHRIVRLWPTGSYPIEESREIFRG